MRGVLTLVIAAALGLGCAYQAPVWESEDGVELDVYPREILIEGFVAERERRFRILFLKFGSSLSFLQTETRAIQRKGADLLIGRIRRQDFYGLVIPGLWLQALGSQNATDVPVIGWEEYVVGGTAIRFVESETLPR